MKSDRKDIKENVFIYRDLVDYQSGTIVSSQIIDRDTGSVTVFAFDKGQRLSEHTAPYDALVQVVDGKGTFTIQGVEHTVSAGQVLIMPAGKPHAVQAEQQFKMVLTMIRARDSKKE
ncbi:MAG: cupin domain-containing protein [bacterium]